MTVRKAFIVAMIAAALALTATAFASTATVTPTATPSYVATSPAVPSTATAKPKSTQNPSGTYDLTWTLPTAGKSGCTVCHSDKDLVRVQGGQTVSLYVNTEILQASAHKDVPCTGCHIDFAYKVPHANVIMKGNEWREVAKSSCKNCHPQEYTDYTSSAHSPSSQPGESSSTVGAPDSSAPGFPRPLCGDCHGGHSIPASNNVEAKMAVHLSGEEMCGKCHKQGTGSYADYYHGAAYQTEAPDAPACWDCHDTHKILASTNRESTVYKDKIIDTCKKCHSDPRDGYTSYGQLVHGKQAVLDANPLYSAVKSAQGAVGSAFGSVKSLFKRGGS
jgi:nitrate/TMAO reductase-like tetraheme cytochrome c subunit